MSKKIYVASSWRCIMQQPVVQVLRAAKFEVYDFKKPTSDDRGFHWSEIGIDYKDWTAEQYRAALSSPLAEKGFKNDFDAMKWADECVLVLSCGRSAHLEAGWFVGAGKPLHILLDCDAVVPELMYKMATSISTSTFELLGALGVKD